VPWVAFGMMTRELRDGEIVVGSATDADWRVTTADLAPRHFLLAMRDNRVTVRPTTTDNVVVVNGEQLRDAERALRDGDVIAAGSGRFAYNVDAPRTTPLDVIEVRQAFLIEIAAGVAHPLNHRSTTIGRDASNEIVLKDPGASRFHGEIRNEAGGFALHSMGSAGAKVGGASIATPCMLHEGDDIEIGFAEFRFTQKPLPPDVGIAPLHSTENDEFGRRPTIGSERLVVHDENEASRHSNQMKLIFAIMLMGILVATVWLTHGEWWPGWHLGTCYRVVPRAGALGSGG
jgi:pSer/pThr/pTyr-binding forkhead associated (FHA) protein